MEFPAFNSIQLGSSCASTLINHLRPLQLPIDDLGSESARCYSHRRQNVNLIAPVMYDNLLLSARIVNMCALVLERSRSYQCYSHTGMIYPVSS